MDTVDVLIVGAGPTGLTMAIECLRYNLTCRIIDQSLIPSPYSKAIAMQARTLEVFQRMGIHQRFLAAGLQIKKANLHSGNKHAHLHLKSIPSPFPFVLSIEQSETEQILYDYLQELGGRVERPVSLLSYEEKEGAILAHTDQGVIQAHYLIGCDGAHSCVRKAMGCTFEGEIFSDIFSLADVKVHWGRPHDELQLFLESDGVAAAFPLPEKDSYRLIFQLKELRGRLYPHFSVDQGIIEPKEIALPTLERMEQLLSNYAKERVTISNPRWIANFHINSRLANCYRKNTVFLAGDAAHIHSPVGGQGMNTGIQDAFNLAWKIAYVHHQFAPASLLNTYEEERHRLGKNLLKNTELASRLVTLHSPLLLFVRNLLLFHLLSFQWIQAKLALALSEVNICYTHKRVPTLLLNVQGKEVDYFTLTEKSKQFHLILFNGAQSPIHHPQITPYYAKDKSSQRALLVRPDGYLALEDRPPFKKLNLYIKYFFTIID
jgi:2-polyprenyl-6-methoxyphenol hydroxylase-like FAD-dependent oxidoreductase